MKEVQFQSNYQNFHDQISIKIIKYLSTLFLGRHWLYD